MKLVALALVALALAACATSSAASGDVRELSVDTTWANVRGQYGKVWVLLHPRYQRVVGRAFWESCQRRRARKTVGVEWLSVRATDDYRDRLPFALLGTLSVTAVSLEAKIDYLGTKRTIRDTIYWIRVGGRWRGLWDRATYRAYATKRCPT
jgi:hypothetical protein